MPLTPAYPEEPRRGVSKDTHPARSGRPPNGPREQGAAGRFPCPAAPELSAHPELPAPAQAGVEGLSFLSPEAIRELACKLDQATALLGFATILMALLWFASASIGASLP